MAESVNLGEFLAKYTQRLLSTTAKSIEDLSPDELHFQGHPDANSIGFDAWHIARTADNLVHFAFEREQPVWLRQGLNEAWGLPKADQGTGMDPATAHALRFPDATLLAQYCRDVSAAIVPRMEKMSQDYLTTTTVIKPQGEMARLDVINQVIVVHGNNHLGQISLARTLQGKPGLGF
ncbi:MAG: DinB family protein [Dehalococcoidia bacterium]